MLSTARHACDYVLCSEDAEYLKAVAVLPFSLRRDLLSRYMKEHGMTALLDLLAQFVGLANSVVSNNREMTELLLIAEGGCTERTAESANLPTIFGALCGVALANTVSKGRAMCEGCAYRLGTPANQSPITSLDATDALDSCSSQFMCHLRGIDEQGQPTLVCAGYAEAQKLSEASWK